MLPRVGQTVLVTLKSAKGEGKLTSKGKRKVETITKVYTGGHVCTQSGDIWNVKPLPTALADFIINEAAEV